MRSVMRYSPLSTSLPIRESVIGPAWYQSRRSPRTPEFTGDLRAIRGARGAASGRDSVPAMTARPYPYATLSRFSTADAALLRGVVRALRATDARATAEAETLLGVRTELRAGAAELWSAADACAELGAAPCGVWLEHDAGARPVADPVRARARARRGARRPRARRRRPRRARRRRGARRCLVRRARVSRGARVRSERCAATRARARVSRRPKRDALFGGGRVLVWPLALRARRRRMPERCACSWRRRVRASSQAARAGSAARDDVAALPVTLCAHAARVTLSRRELARARARRCRRARRCALAREAGAYAGAVELHAIGTDASCCTRTRARPSSRSIRAPNTEITP